MKSPQVSYDNKKSSFSAKSDNGCLDTFFVFPVHLVDGDKLPTLNYYIPNTSKAFHFDGQYNVMTDNLEFLFDGPKGFSYKISLSIDPGSHQPYVWKTKKHGHTTNFEPKEDAIMYVPKYICMEASTQVQAEREVLAHRSLFGCSIFPIFCTMRLKIAVVEGNEWHKIGQLVAKEDYHLTFHKTLMSQPEQEQQQGQKGALAISSGSGGDALPLIGGTMGHDDEKELRIDRKYKSTITMDSTGRVERKTSRSERLHLKQLRPIPSQEIGEASFGFKPGSTGSSDFDEILAQDGQAEESLQSKPKDGSHDGDFTASKSESGLKNEMDTSATSSSYIQQDQAGSALQDERTTIQVSTGVSQSGNEPKIVQISASITKSSEGGAERFGSEGETSEFTPRGSSVDEKVDEKYQLKKPDKQSSDDEREVLRFRYDELKVSGRDDQRKSKENIAKFFTWKTGRDVQEEDKSTADLQKSTVEPNEPLILMEAGSNYSTGIDDTTDISLNDMDYSDLDDPSQPLILMDAGSNASYGDEIKESCDEIPAKDDK